MYTFKQILKELNLHCLADKKRVFGFILVYLCGIFLFDGGFYFFIKNNPQNTIYSILYSILLILFSISLFVLSLSIFKTYFENNNGIINAHVKKSTVILKSAVLFLIPNLVLLSFFIVFFTFTQNYLKNNGAYEFIIIIELILYLILFYIWFLLTLFIPHQLVLGSQEKTPVLLKNSWKLVKKNNLFFVKIFLLQIFFQISFEILQKIKIDTLLTKLVSSALNMIVATILIFGSMYMYSSTFQKPIAFENNSTNIE